MMDDGGQWCCWSGFLISLDGDHLISVKYRVEVFDVLCPSLTPKTSGVKTQH